MFFMKKKRVLSWKKFRSDADAKSITDTVSQNRRRECEQEKPANVYKTGRRDNSGGKKKRVAGKEKTKEKTGLGKNDKRNTKEPYAFD